MTTLVTAATPPFTWVKEDVHAHHDGMPLAAFVTDSTGARYYAMAVGDCDAFPDPDNSLWVMCVVPLRVMDEQALTETDHPGWRRMIRDVMQDANGYYLFDAYESVVSQVAKFVAGPVPEDFKPDL